MSDTIPDPTPQKQCPVCKKTFPATTEYFHTNKTGKHGLRPHCKECRSAMERGKIAVSAEIAPDIRKECAKCHKEFHSTDEFFHRNRCKRDGFHQQCKECKNVSLKIHRCRPEVKERTQSHTRQYQSRPEVQKRIRTYQNSPKAQERIRFYKSRPEVQEQRRINGRNYRSRPEIHERARSRWKEYSRQPEVLEQHRMHEHNRRALKRNTQGTYTIDQIHEQHKRQHDKCYYCHKKLTEYHIEHSVPLSRGGTNDISNLVVACPTCNLKKGNKLPHEWP